MGNCSFLCSEKIRDALKYHEEFVSEAVEEVNVFCENHNWLTEIHQFVTGWDKRQIDYWKAQPTAMIEVSMQLLCTIMYIFQIKK